MIRKILLGVLSGAAGTVALDTASYADMARSGRKASDGPAQLAEKLAERAGIAALAPPAESKDDTTKHRQAAVGALMGYGVGLGIGAAYGMIRPRLRDIPWPMMGLFLGAAAMAAAEGGSEISFRTLRMAW